MFKNCSTKTINLGNSKENQLHRSKITFEENKSKKCNTTMVNKSKNIKRNSKSTGWLLNSTKKKHKWTTINYKKSAKSLWKNKTELGNFKLHRSTIILKVAILIRLFRKTKATICKEDTLTFLSKTSNYGEKKNMTFFTNLSLRIWKEDH